MSADQTPDPEIQDLAYVNFESDNILANLLKAPEAVADIIASDYRDLIDGSTYVGGLTEGLALAEFLFTRNYSSSVVMPVWSVGNLFCPELLFPDATQQFNTRQYFKTLRDV